jgi:uncharacterized protein YndB with AHSA1/START domain
MRYLVMAGAVLAALGAGVFMVGWLLPVGHTASSSAVVAAPPAAVYAAISDVEQYPRWWSEIARVEMLPADGGRVRFREHMSTGPVGMEVEEASAPTRFVTRIADRGQPFGGSWTVAIAPEGAGSRVTITERGEIYNPFFRFMARFVFGYTGTMDSCLRALQAHFSDGG